MREGDSALPAKLRLAIAAALAGALVLLGLSEPWRQLELKGFDVLTVVTAPNASSFPITVVGIDEDSFAQIGRQWPWPRSVHARLMDELMKAGAMVVAFDVVFSEADRGGPAEDKALEDAIARQGHVVLAADQVYVESAHAREWLRVDPLHAFRDAGAAAGFARIELDRDLVARRMPTENDAFWREIARKVEKLHPDVRATWPKPGAMIRFAGPMLTFPYIPYYQVLQPGALPSEALKDQVVIVGRHVQASPDAGAAQSDVFATPFTATSRWFTPGAELHANILETALRGDALYPVPFSAQAALIVALVLGCALGMAGWRPVPSLLLALALAALVLALDWLLFVRFNLWLPAGAPIAGIGSVYASFGALSFLVERRRRVELRRVFGLYVSPEVVDHVMAHPERLRLGGERREVTMLFTDLEAFTSLTERLGAEQVARILNMHFTGATRIVKQHGGTVNRFIGDAVMAMWGAPLDDADQALHACLAACEMQKDITRLNGQLVVQGLPEIHMRIGIHSCTAVVGNLGSDDRFDYTAIGDGVNLAARLEGVNKLYHTGILLSGATASMLHGGLKVRLVDQVIVKGKSEPVDIFTPCDDDNVIDIGARAMTAYRARDWDLADSLWRQVLERVPGDGVALVYLERITRYRSLPLDAEWRGVAELEKL